METTADSPFAAGPFATNPFTAILSDGETILWLGKPDKECFAGPQKKGWRFFAGGILAFLLYGAFSSALTGEPDGYGVLVLSLIFVPLAIGPFFVDWGVPRYQYAVTNQRVFFYSSGGEDIVMVHLALEQISLVSLRTKSDRACSIAFYAKPPFSRIEFYYLADIAEVQELVVSLLTGARQG